MIVWITAGDPLSRKCRRSQSTIQEKPSGTSPGKILFYPSTCTGKISFYFDAISTSVAILLSCSSFHLSAVRLQIRRLEQSMPSRLLWLVIRHYRPGSIVACEFVERSLASSKYDMDGNFAAQLIFSKKYKSVQGKELSHVPWLYVPLLLLLQWHSNHRCVSWGAIVHDNEEVQACDLLAKYSMFILKHGTSRVEWSSFRCSQV